MRNAILIAGPTASGKSAFALERARSANGAIVNADSMQVYSILRVLTARPDADELKAAPHHLYGHVHPSQTYSTGRWLEDVAALIGGGALEGRRPIFVGGTGLYFRALLGGLSNMPEIPESVRTRWRDALARSGPGRLHDVLAKRDPKAAAAIRPSDPQRILRALEVVEASGRSILDWQRLRLPALVDAASAEKYLILPDRTQLNRRIEARLDAMLEHGALDEIEALGALDLDPDLPAMKAIGVPQLLAVREGTLSVTEALVEAKTASRQYAKRQVTWFRHQLGPDWAVISEPS